MKVFRFCNANALKTMLSYRGQAGVSTPADHWRVTRVKTPSLLVRASAHMDGAVDDSPFCSTCTDVLELVKWGHSGGLCDVIYGANNPTYRAPHIVEFDIPFGSYITPIMVTQITGQTTLGLARASKETEVLYFGNDLAHFVSAVKVNPYSNESYKAVIANLDKQDRLEEQRLIAIAEKKEDLEEKSRKAEGWALAELDGGAVKKDITNFNVAIRSFLAKFRQLFVERGFDVDKASNISPSLLSLPLRKILDPLEGEIRAKGTPAMKEAWLALTANYRRS